MVTLLVIITQDPRESGRAAEAVRMAAGVGIWEQVTVNLCLRHAAAAALGESAEGLPEGQLFTQFLQMVRESGGEGYVQADSDTCVDLEGDVIFNRNLKDEKVAELAAQADYVMRI